MANARRGEIDAILDGRTRTLVLTLGALAELEHAFGADDLVALAERFERGRLSARDAARIIAAGLSGAGEMASEEDVLAMRAEGGAAGFARIVCDLLSATFGAVSENQGGSPPRGAAAGTGTPSASPGSFRDTPPGPTDPSFPDARGEAARPLRPSRP